MEGKQKKNYPFNFDSMWMDHMSYKENLKEWWKYEAKGTTMYMLSQKLGEVKRRVNKWNKEIFRNMEERKLEREGELKLIKHDILRNGRIEDLDKK